MILHSLILTSTLAQVGAPTTAPGDPGVSAATLWVTGGLAVSAILTAWVTRLFRPSSIGHHRRIPAGRPVAPLVGVMFAAIVLWLVVPSLFIQATSDASGGATSMPSSDVASPPTVVPASRLVILSATVPVLALAVLLIGNFIVRPRVGQDLGFAAVRSPLGFLGGAGAMVLVMPVVFFVMVATEMIYRQFGYQHPKEHDLLKVMGESAPMIRNLAVLAAVLVAPLWEEILFRGHIQTLLFEWFARIRESLNRPSPVTAPARPGNTLEYFATPPESTVVAPNEPTDRVAHPVAAWLAVLVTSMLFASVHPIWTWPPIFVLSVCFGLAYERTGNLWVSIAMHAAFNGVMTAIYLTGVFAAN